MEPLDAPPSASDLNLQPEPPAVDRPAAGGGIRTLRAAPERREMALILGLVLLLNFVPGGFLQLANLRWGLLLTQILLIAGPVFLAIRVFYLDRRSVIPLTWPGTRAMTGAVLGALGLNHILNYLVVWQDRLFPLPALWRSLFETLGRFNGPADFLVLVVLLGVIPGVCEEMLFRGFVQTGLRKSLESGPKAIAIGALIFALFHLNPWRFDVLLIIGLYLGFLMERTGSLITCIVAHALINIQSVALAALGEEAQGSAIHSPWSHVLACVCLLAAARILRRAPA